MILIGISWIRISYKRMKAIETPTLSNKLSFKLEYPFKKNFFNLLSFQRSFAYISYPCQ